MLWIIYPQIWTKFPSVLSFFIDFIFFLLLFFQFHCLWKKKERLNWNTIQNKTKSYATLKNVFLSFSYANKSLCTIPCTRLETQWWPWSYGFALPPSTLGHRPQASGSIHTWDLLGGNYLLNNGLYCIKCALSHLLFGQLLHGLKSSIMGCVST